MLTDGRTDDGRKVITIAHPEQSSGELKIPIKTFLCSTQLSKFKKIVSILSSAEHEKSFITSRPGKKVSEYLV